MDFWWWVLVFVAIAAVGAGVYALLGLRLWRKARLLMTEVGTLTALMSELEGAVAIAGAPRVQDGVDAST